MTGKEALEYIANLLFMFTSTGRKSGKNYTLKALCKIEDELEQLTKNKRAFEILKEKFSLDKTEIFGNGNLYFLNGIDSCWEISQEEYELLEEVMKNEKAN